ncbi:MAG: hypothetical protein ACOC1K_02370 [Nanoarchaeota archaeon]
MITDTKEFIKNYDNYTKSIENQKEGCKSCDLIMAHSISKVCLYKCGKCGALRTSPDVKMTLFAYCRAKNISFSDAWHIADDLLSFKNNYAGNRWFEEDHFENNLENYFMTGIARAGFRFKLLVNAEKQFVKK